MFHCIFQEVPQEITEKCPDFLNTKKARASNLEDGKVEKLNSLAIY